MDGWKRNIENMGPGIKTRDESLSDVNKTSLAFYHSNQSWNDNQVGKSSQLMEPAKQQEKSHFR